MVGVLYTIRFNYFDSSVIPFNREAHLVNGITLADLFQQSFIPFGEFGCFVETSLKKEKKE